MFQFLIGRLKTAGGGSMTAVELAFQFLIGRLKTRAMATSFQSYIIVSIPYR